MKFFCVSPYFLLSKGIQFITNFRKSSVITAFLLLLNFILLFEFVLSLYEVQHSYSYDISKTNLPDFNFVAAGDWGCTPNSKETVHAIINKNPELVLGLGDYSYRNSADCWLQLIEPINNKMKIVIGNHEHLDYSGKNNYYSSPERLRQYMNYFNLTQQYYSFDYQNVHFIAMSTEIPYERGSKQFEFVKSDLEKTVANSSINWIVVFYHRIAYTSPSYLPSNPALRETYHPLFEKNGVDLIMQGHSHNYQRSYPIKFNKENPLKPLIMDKNMTNYHKSDSQIYTIVGTGGATDEHKFPSPGSTYTAVQFNAFGFLNVNVLYNGTLLEGIFYDNSGKIRDHFIIVS